MTAVTDAEIEEGARALARIMGRADNWQAWKAHVEQILLAAARARPAPAAADLIRGLEHAHERGCAAIDVEGEVKGVLQSLKPLDLTESYKHRISALICRLQAERDDAVWVRNNLIDAAAAQLAAAPVQAGEEAARRALDEIVEYADCLRKQELEFHAADAAHVIAVARKAAALPRPQEGWKPIETAPKDMEVEVRGRWKLRGDGVEFTHWRPTPATQAEGEEKS